MNPLSILYAVLFAAALGVGGAVVYKYNTSIETAAIAKVSLATANTDIKRLKERAKDKDELTQRNDELQTTLDKERAASRVRQAAADARIRDLLRTKPGFKAWADGAVDPDYRQLRRDTFGTANSGRGLVLEPKVGSPASGGAADAGRNQPGAGGGSGAVANSTAGSQPANPQVSEPAGPSGSAETQTILQRIQALKGK